MRGRGTQEVAAGQGSVERLLSQEQLEAVVVLDEAGVDHAQIDHLLL